MRLFVVCLFGIVLCNACSDSAPSPQASDAIGVSGAPSTGMAMAESGATSARSESAAAIAGRGAGQVSASAAGAAGAAVAPQAGATAMRGGVAAGSGADAATAAAAGQSGASAMMPEAGASGAAGSGVVEPATEPIDVGHPHRFLVSVHGGGADKLVYVDVDDAAAQWELDVPDGIQDFQLIGNNKLLVGYKFNFGYFEVDLETHRVDVEVRDFLTRDQAILTSVKRLANGHTLIMGQGLQGGSSDMEVWEVDNAKMVYEKRTFARCCGNLRVVRLTEEGHFLVGNGEALVELDDKGEELARMSTGGSPTYMGLKTSDGAYYATNGHGGQLLGFGSDQTRRVLGGRSSPSAQDVRIAQPGQFQILQNGHIVITNWTAEDGGSGQQLVEYDPEGNMVWSWDDPKVRPQGIETLIVLDNLDPSVLNDDRDGVLKPMR